MNANYGIKHTTNLKHYKSMISDIDKCNYMQILTKLNKYHANIFTQKELSQHLNVSVRKISDFKNGKVIDFWLLCQYAAIIGKEIKFNIS